MAARHPFIILQQKIVGLTINYLDKQGYFNNKPLNDRGFTPWFTYPAISFLDDIVADSMKVFEYGSGYSTLYFSSRVKECLSVEHDPEWARRLCEANKAIDIIVAQEGASPEAGGTEALAEFKALTFELPISDKRDHNVEHGLLNDEFVGYASKIFLKPNGYYDIIVLDGMARALCGYLAANMIAENGIIILDNSDRWQYNSLHKHLIQNGFGRIDFWGPGPVNAFPWCTSFFSKKYGIKNNLIERPPKSGDLGW